ncbi:cupredoxin domain-containing protein [Paenibacillus sp. sptzw28]|uniref:cupredoxin domain-containing protein n=1 Tax=Paenibacillus sp. sptzw28 TaxID=715179 RepID=UPI001C6E66D4|nr:cupredoxin domain-containing protein [Paenibacillus sp. sptzw28]QYR20565.1 cupredoxin domain-containing protein [Paenibacillus sp. sptzw28]
MAKIFVVSKKQIRLFAILILVLFIAAACLKWNQTRTAMAIPPQERVFHLVTGEFQSKTADGKEIEVYRWDPGTLIVNAGEQVELRITGINGASHPFVIEGLGVKGEVTKGKTTSVRFSAETKGTYPIVCLTHTTMDQGGPMVGYIVVQ